MTKNDLIRKHLLGVLSGALLLVGTPVIGLAQTNGTSPVNIFSQWVKLSLMGYNQSEIEATLSVYQPEALQEVKHRLRRNVLNNLMGGNLQQDISLSSTEQELRYIRDKIRTEIRFAGLENDPQIRTMIRHQFGISMQDI